MLAFLNPIAGGRLNDTLVVVTDPSPTKDFIINLKDDMQQLKFFRLSFMQRPPAELFDVERDPYQLHNLAGNTEHAATQKQLRAELDRWMRDTRDPRAASDDDRWDQYPYSGQPGRAASGSK